MLEISSAVLRAPSPYLPSLYQCQGSDGQQCTDSNQWPASSCLHPHLDSRWKWCWFIWCGRMMLPRPSYRTLH